MGPGDPGLDVGRRLAQGVEQAPHVQGHPARLHRRAPSCMSPLTVPYRLKKNLMREAGLSVVATRVTDDRT